MNKRGISHIEVILSFLIFIGFVIFALYFFSPFKADRVIGSSLSYAVKEIIKNASVEIDSYSIRLNANTKDDIGKIIEIRIEGLNSKKNVRAESYIGEEISSRREAGNNDIIRIRLDNKLYGFNGNEGFVILKFSEDIDKYGNSNDLNGILADEENLYEIGTINKIKIVSEKRIIELKNIYEKGSEDYKNIKKNFNLPNRVNFAFSLSFDNGEKIEAKQDIPKGLGVFPNLQRIEVLQKDSDKNKNDRINFGDLTIIIW